MIRAVLFEPDGTLFEAGYGAEKFFRAQARRWVDATARGRQNEEELAMRLLASHAEADAEEFYARIVREFGLPLRAARVMRREYDDGWARAARPLDGARLMLDRLARRGHRLGVVAEDGVREQVRRLELAGLGERFDTVFITAAHGLGRVDGELVRLAVHCLGVAPEEAAFVSATRERALAAAGAAGLHTVWLGSDFSGAAGFADLRLRRLDQLADALEGLAPIRAAS
jgi:FMN phosphatase YigB (HAD superfamily)